MASLLPTPKARRRSDRRCSQSETLRALNGQTVALVESMKGGWGGASNSREAPADWIARRSGGCATCGARVTCMRSASLGKIALACGIPTALLAESPTGTGTREAWRQFLVRNRRANRQDWFLPSYRASWTRLSTSPGQICRASQISAGQGSGAFSRMVGGGHGPSQALWRLSGLDGSVR